MEVNYLAGNSYSQQTSFYSSSALRRWAEKLISDTAQLPRRARGPFVGLKALTHFKVIYQRAVPCTRSAAKAAAIMPSYFLKSAPLTHASPQLWPHLPLASLSSSSSSSSSSCSDTLINESSHRPSRAEMFLNCADVARRRPSRAHVWNTMHR